MWEYLHVNKYTFNIFLENKQFMVLSKSKQYDQYLMQYILEWQLNCVGVYILSFDITVE